MLNLVIAYPFVGVLEMLRFLDYMFIMIFIDECFEVSYYSCEIGCRWFRRSIQYGVGYVYILYEVMVGLVVPSFANMFAWSLP